MTIAIGEVAKGAGIGIETVRFYEREGLIDDPPRTEAGYRQYPDNVILRVRFIRQAKELGFSLKDIKELLSLRLLPGTTCKDIRERTTRKIDEIEEKIQTLQKMKNILTALETDCKGHGSINACPILEALDQGPAHENQ